MTATPRTTDLSQLRRDMRRRRAALSLAQRQAYAEAAARHCQRRALFHRAQHLAVYFAQAGELDPAPVVWRAWEMGKTVYLPVLLPGPVNRMRFAPWHAGSELVSNRFGIPEPQIAARHLRHGAQLDLVLTPLVAFDTQGNRVGMGAGYYDRSFTIKRLRRAWRRPRLVGYAYDFQGVESLPIQAWDIPLDAVVTESAWIDFSPA